MNIVIKFVNFILHRNDVQLKYDDINFATGYRYAATAIVLRNISIDTMIHTLDTELNNSQFNNGVLSAVYDWKCNYGKENETKGDVKHLNEAIRLIALLRGDMTNHVIPRNAGHAEVVARARQNETVRQLEMELIAYNMGIKRQ